MSPLKATLKRGALVAAANWQVTLIQSAADSLFKLLVSAPAIGGVFFVALVIGAEPQGLLQLEWREMVTTIASALMSQPTLLVAFVLALSVVVIGGSVIMFMVKAGTIATLVDGDRRGHALEVPPLHLATVATAGAFNADAYIAACEHFFHRYLRLGFGLIGVYVASALGVLTALTLPPVSTFSVGGAAVLTIVFVSWITLVNLAYLLLQIIIVVDDCGLVEAARRVTAFLRTDHRGVFSVFGVILAMVVVGTGVSVIAMGALGLIAFVPLFGLAVLPLQLLAWIFRGVVFQFIGLTSVVAYLRRYRESGNRVAQVPEPLASRTAG